MVKEDKFEIKAKTTTELVRRSDSKDRKYDETECEELIREKAKSNVWSRVFKKDKQPLSYPTEIWW